MWDEEWQSESRYSKDVTGYTECDEDFIKSLEDTFGAVKINPADFKGYDAYFTIEGYKSMKDAIESAYWQKTINFIMAATTMKSQADSFRCCAMCSAVIDIAFNFCRKKIKVKRNKKRIFKNHVE